MSGLLVASFVAGFLTVLAPCILPLLPVMLTGAGDKGRRLVVIIAGLTVSIIVFSLLLKSLTVLIGVPQEVWQTLSAVALGLFGVAMLFPHAWERISSAINRSSSHSLAQANRRRGFWGDFALGAALGPVFNSCSPTYALIVAVILPASFGQGLGYLFVYALGLAAALSLIAIAGRGIIARLGWAVDPNGWFRRLLGGLLIIVGLSVLFGLDKQLQTFLLDRGYYDAIVKIEDQIRLPR